LFRSQIYSVFVDFEEVNEAKPSLFVAEDFQTFEFRKVKVRFSKIIYYQLTLQYSNENKRCKYDDLPESINL